MLKKIKKALKVKSTLIDGTLMVNCIKGIITIRYTEDEFVIDHGRYEAGFITYKTTVKEVLTLLKDIV